MPVVLRHLAPRSRLHVLEVMVFLLLFDFAFECFFGHNLHTECVQGQLILIYGATSRSPRQAIVGTEGKEGGPAMTSTPAK